MRSDLTILADLARSLRAPHPLEEVLQRVAQDATEVLEAPRSSVRLLDGSGTSLMAVVRSGDALHHNAAAEFKLGEGLVGWIAQHGEPLRLGHAQADLRFQPRPDIKEPVGSFLGVPLTAGRTCLGVLSAVHPQEDHFTPRHEELALLLAAICGPYVEIARLARLSQVDPLTGTLNRRGLEDIPGEDKPGRRRCVVVVDIDHFKRVNDEHGHAVGDEVLRQVANALAESTRAGDAVVRLGGEEFLLVLPGVELSLALRIAERARKRIAGSPFRAGGLTVPVTVSLGVAEQQPGESRDAVVQRADAAMYDAKQAGRNQVRSRT